MKRDFKNTRVSVVGLARSGIAAACALQQAGALVFGSDKGNTPEERLKPLVDARISFETGGHSDRVLEADLLVISPGVPMISDIIVSARKKDIPVISEIELAYLMTDADIIGITGSNGKSTTTALLGELMKHAPFKTRVGGNIGEALSGELDGMGRGDALIAEISSFQLDSVQTFRPNAAAILNLTPDHLDRYPTADDYYASKIGITRNQQVGDLLVLNHDDPISRSKLSGIRTRADLAFFSVRDEVSCGAFVRNGRILIRNSRGEFEVGGRDEVGLIGLHNLANILAAVIIADYYDISLEKIRETLVAFKGIEHRIEFVRTLNHVTYYNDSKGTNVDSVRWALAGLKGPIHLIAGGRDKEGDFSLLNDLIREKVAVVYAIGEAALKMKRVWEKVTSVTLKKDMRDAVTSACQAAKPGEVVLLSPACASFDMYKNYEERGRDFKNIVRGL